MSSERSRRTFSSVKLTRRHHFAYLGLWVVLTIVLVVLVNVLVYMLARERWMGGHAGRAAVAVTGPGRTVLLGVLCTEVLCFAIAVVLLAKFTAHRIAGPYVRLKNVFGAVKAGDLDLHMKFRDYDKLEDVAEAFNEMLTAIRDRKKEKPDVAQ